MDLIEKLYKNYDVLNSAKDKAKEHEAEYMEILQAVKGATNEKRLASQFIVRFFKHFPSLSEQAIDAVMDLCEDEDVAIRKQAIKDLPHLCRENRTFLPKISDVLAQMLQSDDPTEVKEVHNSLCVLLKMDAKGCLYGLFSQIQCEDAEENGIRERATRFLATKLKSLGKDVITKDVEEVLWNETKKSLKDAVSGEDFTQLVDILSHTQTASSTSGRQQLVDLIAEQLESSEQLQLADDESRHKLLLCLQQAAKFISGQVRSTVFVSRLVDSVLPRLAQLDEDSQLELLKPLAELSSNAGQLEKMEAVCDAIYLALTDRMPLPVTDASGANGEEAAAEDGSAPPAAAVVEPPALLFSHVECLMYTFHQLVRHHPETLSADRDDGRLQDFRLRLQYLARGTQAYMRSLRESLKTGGGGADTKPAPAQEGTADQQQLRQAALRTTSNINTMIRDLFHTPPIYKCQITLSWKSLVTSSNNGSVEARSGEKRRAPITFGDSDASAVGRPKGGRAVYQPPSGKYSDRAGGYQESRRGGGGGYRPRYRGNRRGY